MSTYMLKKSCTERKRYIVDACGKPLGRVAAQVAVLLRGKHRVTFTPNVDCGDHVVVVNCNDVVLTGKKLYQKCRYRYTGYIGHLKTERYSKILMENPEKAVRLAVKGMLPNSSVGRREFLRLRTYRGSACSEDVNNSTVWEVK